jgi:hypothetical protein
MMLHLYNKYILETIPVTLAPFFQEYAFEKLDLKSAASLIIERTLQFGNRAELHWLFTQYSRAQIAGWYRQYAKERLPDPHNAFWRIILEIEE